MPGPRVAYILLWFPEPTQTFILDEVNTMFRLGLDLRVYTLYGPRSPSLVSGMAPVTVPVIQLGTASLRKVPKELVHLPRLWGSGAAQFLRKVVVRRWRNLETAGEAFWAALAGVHLARVFKTSGIDHIHAPWANGPATAAWVASRLSGIPFSFCAHAYDIYPPDGALREKIADASLVRVISEINRHYLMDLAPGYGEKIVTIRYGVPLTPVATPTRPRHTQYRLLAIGRLVTKKGFPVLLKACGHLRDLGVDFHLTMAGDGPQRPKLLNVIREYGLKEQVTLTGFVPHRQIPTLFHQADLFIAPCIIDPTGDRDGIPNVILESMAHEVPVVGTDVSGISEAIRPGETGWLVPPGDPQALAQAVIEALADPAEARRRARAGKKLVRQEFDSRKNYGQLKTCLERLIREDVKIVEKRPGSSLQPFSPKTQDMKMPGPRVAYILLWFPEPSQTFVLDEVNTLWHLGLNIQVFTLYGPRSPSLVAGMAPVAAPVTRLGLPGLGVLLKDLVLLRRNWGPQAGPFLGKVMARRWRNLEVAGEALWAALAGVRLARLFKAAGIDHIHAPWADGPATAAWVASHLSGIPFSFCARATDLHPPDGALLEKLKAAALVRTNALSNLKYLAELAPQEPGKIVNIYNGVSFSSEPAPSRPPHSPFRLLALGRLVAKKGFPILLASCRQLADQGLDFRLTLAGDGPQRVRMENLVKEYGLGGRVTLPGFIPHREVPGLFREADLFIMPSLIAPSGDRDGIPNVVLEALAHEVPVVATAVSGLPEVIHPGETGWLVPPADPRALTQAVLAALADPAEARRRGRAGRELVRRQFDSRNNYAQLKACFEAVAGG